ncbi:hypothetical protein J6590_092904 [Homalodisca vitripennis]|nr:hypothetical protein J6590_092904 [Homalodisca vitripennis]
MGTHVGEGDTVPLLPQVAFPSRGSTKTACSKICVPARDGITFGLDCTSSFCVDERGKGHAELHG